MTQNNNARRHWGLGVYNIRLLTTGKKKHNPSLTTSWVLRQFSSKKKKAELEYREFVKFGIGEESVWEKVEGQALLGQEGFVKGLIDHLKTYKEGAGVPKSQRYASRSALEKILKESILKDRVKLDRVILELIERYRYTQRGVTNYLGMHLTYISRTSSGR